MTARFSADWLQTPARASGSSTRRPEDASAADASRDLQATCQAEALHPTHTGCLDERYVPATYEPGYAYPLIVWLTAPGGSAGRLAPVMSRISDRNYLGAALELESADGADERVFEIVSRLRRQLHVHTERVYVAGTHEQGTWALRLGLSRPEWFAGAIALGSSLPAGGRPLAQFGALRGKRIFLASSGLEASAEAVHALRRLWTAGLDVYACQAASNEPHDPGVLLEIDRWLMRGIEGA